jgi:hypothetical protein
LNRVGGIKFIGNIKGNNPLVKWFHPFPSQPSIMVLKGRELGDKEHRGKGKGEVFENY